MSYRLELDDRLGAAVLRTALERVDHAIGQLRESAVDDRETAVHDARKDLKKLRSLLRLIVPGLEASTRRRENAILAEIGRSLSAARDADVMVEVVDDLAERAAGQAPAATFAALRVALLDAAQETREGDEAGTLERAAAELDAARGRWAAWSLDDLDDAALVEGLTRAYRRGRTDLDALHDDAGRSGDERWHDWRKRVKDLWYQQRLLHDAWPPILKAQADVLDELAELLGDDHDLAVLQARILGEDGSGGVAVADVDQVLTAITGLRAELHGAACSIGRRVYAEKPSAYARRHARYLRVARVVRAAPTAAD